MFALLQFPNNDNRPLTAGGSSDQFCDCGLPIDQCLEKMAIDAGMQLGGFDMGTGSISGDVPFNTVFPPFEFETDFDDGDDDEVNSIEAVASLGRILENQSNAALVYAELIASKFGSTPN